MLLKKCLYFFFVFFPLVYYAPSVSAAETRENKLKIFSLIAEGTAAVQTLSSDFFQERHLSMLKEPLVSSGKFAYAKPDRLYWEIIKPSPAGFIVRGDKARRWNSDQGTPETLEINQDPMIRAIVEQVFAWTRADFAWLEKRYRITLGEEASHSLRLTPLSFQEKKFLAHMTIVFSEDWTHVRSVELHEKGGDFTRLRFVHTLLNPTLPNNIFEK